MDKTNYSVARVETYTRASIVKAERHNERKNESYSNMNVDLTQTLCITKDVKTLITKD